MPTHPIGERKLATMLFVDLCGFTQLSRSVDPEDVAARVRPILEGLAGIAERYGALLGPAEGDGFLAIFGLPQSHDDDPYRAVAAAATMRRFADGLNPDDPGIHVGIATGEVYATFESERWTVNGAAVNLASRLCSAAVEGEVLVDEQCAKLVVGRVGWKYETHLALKGHDEPQRAYLLADLLDLVASEDRIVGRERERQVLRQALEDVAATRRSRVVVIRGEAGIGKTTLARDVGADDPTATFSLAGRCRGFGGDQPLGAIVDAIRTSSATTDDQSLEQALSSLGVKEATALSERWRFFVGDAARASPGELIAGRDATLLSLTRRLLVAIANRRPTVLVIDDFHLAPSDIRSFVDSVCAEPLPSALLLIVTARSEAQFCSAVEILPLGPVTEEEAQEIAIAHAGDLSREIAAQLAFRTGGNPLFIRECANLVRRTDRLDSDSGAVSSLPETVRLVLAARLDDLKAPEKALLQAASTWGDEGPIHALDYLGRTWMPESRRQIDGLFEINDRGWRFAHSLVREVSYASVPKRDRARRHAALLQSPVLSSSQRAFHATAVVELDVAGDETERASALAIAIREVRGHVTNVYAIEARAAYDAVTRASNLIERAAMSAPSDAFALLMVASAAAVEIGLPQEGQGHASRAFMLVEDLDSEVAAAEAWIARGRCSTRLGDHEQARVQGQRALQIAREAGSQEMAGRALVLIGETYRYSSFEKWVGLLGEAFEAFDAIGDKSGCAETSRIAAYILSTGSGPAYQVWIDRAKAFTSPEDLRGQAWIARAEMFAANDRGRWVEAVGLASQTLALGEEAGLRDVVFDARRMRLEACTALGWSQEITGLIESLREMQDGEPQESHMRMAVATSSARALQRWVSADAADHAMSLAFQIVESLGDVDRADCLLVCGDVLAERGDWTQALLSYGEVEAVANSAEQPQSLLTARTRGLRVRQALGETISPHEVEDLVKLLLEGGSVGNLAILSALWPGSVSDTSDAGRTPEVDALAAEAEGRDEDAVWAWTQLGNTCWLAAALDRVGNHERAEDVRAHLRP